MGWASYHPFTAAFHQSCLIYLLRRWRDLIRDHPPPHFAARVKATLQQALSICDRRAAAGPTYTAPDASPPRSAGVYAKSSSDPARQPRGQIAESAEPPRDAAL